MQDAAVWSKKVVEALQTGAESNEIDFKEGLSEDVDRLKEHINALGHLVNGGLLVFGVTRGYEAGIYF